MIFFSTLLFPPITKSLPQQLIHWSNDFPDRRPQTRLVDAKIDRVTLLEYQLVRPSLSLARSLFQLSHPQQLPPNTNKHPSPISSGPIPSALSTEDLLQPRLGQGNLSLCRFTTISALSCLHIELGRSVQHRSSLRRACEESADSPRPSALDHTSCQTNPAAIQRSQLETQTEPAWLVHSFPTAPACVCLCGGVSQPTWKVKVERDRDE